MIYIITCLIWLALIGMTLYAVLRWRELRDETDALRAQVEDAIVEKREQAADFERMLRYRDDALRAQVEESIVEKREQAADFRTTTLKIRETFARPGHFGSSKSPESPV